MSNPFLFGVGHSPFGKESTPHFSEKKNFLEVLHLGLILCFFANFETEHGADNKLVVENAVTFRYLNLRKKETWGHIDSL